DFHVTGVQTCALPIFAVYRPQSVGDAAGRAADPAGQVHDQRPLRGYLDVRGKELVMQLPSGAGIAEEEVPGVLVVDEMRPRSLQIGRASCRERVAITE